MNPTLLAQARWISETFPHFAEWNPHFSIFDSAERLEWVFGAPSVHGKEIDAETDIDTGMITVHRRVLKRHEKEVSAILLHELSEAHGIQSRLFHGYGFGIIRPEHEYAEFIEDRYRKVHGMPSCLLALTPEQDVLMRRLNKFLRVDFLRGDAFFQGRKYLGCAAHSVLLFSPHDVDLDQKVTEELRRYYPK